MEKKTKKYPEDVKALFDLIKKGEVSNDDPELSRVIDRAIKKEIDNPSFTFGGPKGMDIIGGALQKRRNELGIAQNAMAKSLGYKNAQFLSKIEKGTSKIPPERIDEFMEAYQITDDMFQPAVVYLTHRKMWPMILNIISAAGANSQFFDKELNKWIRKNMM